MANKYSKSGRIIPTFNRDEYLANVLNKPTTAENNTLVQEESNQDKGNFLLRAGSTISDVTENFATGVGSAFEGIFDFATSLVSGTFKLFGNNEISDQINDFIKKDYIKDAFTTMGKQTDLFTLGWTIKDAIEGKEDAWTTNLFEKINRGADVEDMSYLSELPDNVEDTVRGGIQSVGQMVPSIAMGNIGGQVASLSTLGLSATGNATKEGLEESNDIGKSLAYGIGSGAIEVASELVVGKALSKLGLGTGKILGVVGKDGAKQIGKKGATRVITDLLKTFNEEGVEEVFSDILNPVLKKLTINQDQSIEDIFNNNGGVNGLLESYLVGGTIGALFGGAEVTSGAKTFKGINNYYAYQDAQAILETRNEIAEEMQKTKGESSKKLERLQTKLAEQENSFRKNFEGFLDKIIKNPKILQEYRDNTQLVSDALADKDYIQKQLVEKNLNGANIEYVKGKEYSSYNPSTNTYKINLDKAKTLKGLKSVIMHEYGHNLASTKDNATRVNSVNDYVEKDLGINKSSKEYKDYKAKYSKEAEAFMDNNFSNLSKDSEEYKTQYKAYINEEIAMDSLAKQNLSLNDYQRIIGNEPKSKIKRFINRFIDIIENHTESKNYNATKKFLKQLSTKAELESDYVEQRLADVRAKKDTRKTSQDNVNRDVKKQKFDDEVFDKWLDELLLEDDDYDLLKKYEDIPSVQYGWNNDYSKFYWNGKEIKNRYRIEQLEQRMEEQQPSTNKIEVANNPTPRTLNIAPLNLFKQSNTKIMEFRNSGKYARLSSERLQNEIERSKARFSPDYAKEYITQISPQEFLEMTKGTESVLQDPGDDSSAKLGVLDLDKLTKDRQTPYLIINQSTKEIIGHEGRHRMYALMKAGYTKADVLLIGSSLDKSYDKYNTKPINDVIFKSQMFSSGRASNQRL